MSKIVVGVDGSPNSARALRWALDEARLRSAEVVAVHAWQYPYAGGLPMETIPIIDRDQLVKQATQVLDETIDPVLGPDDTSTTVHRQVIEGSAGRVLLDAAEGADLLVVGSRGLGGFMGVLLGSVSHRLAHLSTIPTVIVHDPADSADRSADTT